MMRSRPGSAPPARRADHPLPRRPRARPARACSRRCRTGARTPLRSSGRRASRHWSTASGSSSATSVRRWRCARRRPASGIAREGYRPDGAGGSPRLPGARLGARRGPASRPPRPGGTRGVGRADRARRRGGGRGGRAGEVTGPARGARSSIGRHPPGAGDRGGRRGATCSFTRRPSSSATARSRTAPGTRRPPRRAPSRPAPGSRCSRSPTAPAATRARRCWPRRARPSPPAVAPSDLDTIDVPLPERGPPAWCPAAGGPALRLSWRRARPDRSRRTPAPHAADQLHRTLRPAHALDASRGRPPSPEASPVTGIDAPPHCGWRTTRPARRRGARLRRARPR